MSHTSSLSKSYPFDSAPLKTPNIKEVSSVINNFDKSKDVTSNPPIIMDEYGQTPDHFYLARKQPPSFYQVKRKLDLQQSEASTVANCKSKNRKKLESTLNSRGKASTEKARYDTSLGQLTKRFLRLMSDATDGVINLNIACAILRVPKRRLYDITNVLEGAGLIQKTSRNNIQWMGRSSSPHASVLKYNLEKEIDILEAKENKLDELLYHMKSEIKAIKETDGMYHYVTSDDLRSIEEFAKSTLIGVKTSSIQLIKTYEKKVEVSSNNSEVEAYLLCEDASFINVLHPQAEFKENSYNVHMQDNCFTNIPDNETSSPPSSSFEIFDPFNIMDGSSAFPIICTRTTWGEGEAMIKNAFITEEDDIAPMGKHFLLQTEDQDLDIYPYVKETELESDVNNYSFALDEDEGLTDLFDCNISVP